MEQATAARVLWGHLPPLTAARADSGDRMPVVAAQFDCVDRMPMTGAQAVATEPAAVEPVVAVLTMLRPTGLAVLAALASWLRVPTAGAQAYQVAPALPPVLVAHSVAGQIAEFVAREG
jgi:hypothetical protein